MLFWKKKCKNRWSSNWWRWCWRTERTEEEFFFQKKIIFLVVAILRHFLRRDIEETIYIRIFHLKIRKRVKKFWKVISKHSEFLPKVLETSCPFSFPDTYSSMPRQYITNVSLDEFFFWRYKQKYNLQHFIQTSP